ncbi:MAG TPA: alanine racemase [Phycisphaerae bacterium]|nr:alanine racemase [Phycisphaerae bacterium]
MIPQHGILEISRSRLAHNVREIRRQIPPHAQICATIKADAYGHSVRHIAPLLSEADIRWAAVFTLQEALDVASAANFHILMLAPLVLESSTDEALAPLLANAPRIRPTLIDLASARRLSEMVSHDRPGSVLPVHIQIDTGLTRGGADPADAADLAAAIHNLPGLHLEGVFAHLSHGDVPHHDASSQQLADFHALADPLKRQWPRLLLHLQNSGGAWSLNDPSLDMVRTGIALYGLQPSTAAPILQLQPIARVTAPVLAVHHRPAGTGVGYGHSFIADRPSHIAVVPVGYADGYPRLASNRGLIAQLNGHAAPLVGRISMDQMTIDVTGIPAALGDQVTVVSWNVGDANSLDALADSIGTIGYELATHFGPRLKRIVVE